MTFVWFVVWLVFGLIGDWEPLRFDPVNIWAGTFLAAVALDLARQHAPAPARRERERAAPAEPAGT